MVSVFNDHILAASAPHPMPLRPEPLGKQLPGRYCFMMERPEDKAAALDARVCGGRQRLAEALGASFGEPASVGEPVQVRRQRMVAQVFVTQSRMKKQEKERKKEKHANGSCPDCSALLAVDIGFSL